jgi:hypothetical protein
MAARKGAGPGSAATDLEARETVGIDNAAVSKASPQDPQAAPKSWRDVLPIHPAADLFPLMSPDELRALGEDIRKHGVKNSIVIWASDPDSSKEYLLAGRNRLDAMEAAGLAIIDHKRRVSVRQIHLYSAGKARSFIDGSSLVVDPYAYVVSANIHRRHLTTEQKRELIGKLIETDPSKSDRQIADTVKASPTTVGTVRAKMEAKGDVSKLDTRTDSKGRQQSAKKKKTKRGTVKFTPERMQQIRNLVERGKTHEEIAEIIGVTVGSLLTTCSRLGISVQKPLPAVKPVPSEDAASRDDVGPASNGEIERKGACIEELQAEKRRLQIENIGLRSEVEEAKAASKSVVADAAIDVIDPVSDIVARRELKKILSATSPYGRAGLIRALRQVLERLERGDATALDLPSDDGLDIPALLPRAAS